MSIFLRPCEACSLMPTEPTVSPSGSTVGYYPTPPRRLGLLLEPVWKSDERRRAHYTWN